MAAANVEPKASPVDAWRRLREVEGPHATVIDLYELVARPRGLAAHELPLQERVTLARSVMPGGWPGFAQTDGSERGGDTIMIIDYDPGWPSRYERWRDVVRSCLDDTAVGVEHVGSTSVPGLAAKPLLCGRMTASPTPMPRPTSSSPSSTLRNGGPPHGAFARLPSRRRCRRGITTTSCSGRSHR